MIYAGIDEAGYGPLVGPLVVASSAFAVPDGDAEAPPCLWRALSRAVAPKRGRGERRIPVADSKAIYRPKEGVGGLERGVLAFARHAGVEAATVGDLLAALGAETEPGPPWHRPTDDWPWAELPAAVDAGVVGIAANQLGVAARSAGVETAWLGAGVLFADRFNAMAAQARSKAGVSFSLVARELARVWRSCAGGRAYVAIDRQSGRRRYREPLMQAFPDAALRELGEDEDASHYRLEAGDRAMTVVFRTGAEETDLPAALASMTAKYLRQLLMRRLQAWFQVHAPEIAPTEGYGKDGRRFCDEVIPRLPELGAAEWQLRRRC